MFRVVSAVARMISSRRLLVANERLEECIDPYDSFVHVFSDDNIERLYVRLEALHTSIMAAKTARDSTIKDAAKVQAILGQHAVDMCKTSMFGCGVSFLIQFSMVQVPTILMILHYFLVLKT